MTTVERALQAGKQLVAAARRGGRPIVDLGAGHAESSVISSAVDLRPPPSPELIDLAVRAADVARTIDLAPVEARCRTDADLAHVAARF